MEQLDTPTGPYNLEELQRIAGGIYKRIKSPAFERDDLYHDLIVYLLEGKTMSGACSAIKEQYKRWNKKVSIFTIPQELVAVDNREDNERILTDSERMQIQQQFFSLLDSLTANERRLMIHVSLGFSNREIAKAFGQSYGYIRKYKCNTIKKMRSALRQ